MFDDASVFVVENSFADDSVVFVVDPVDDGSVVVYISDEDVSIPVSCKSVIFAEVSFLR